MISPGAAPLPPTTEVGAQQLLVVDDPDDVPEHPSGWEVVHVRDYIFGGAERWGPSTTVWNSSRETGFLEPGFCVSHQAEARGHVVVPSARALVRAAAPLTPPAPRDPGPHPTLGILYDEDSIVRPCRPDTIRYICDVAASMGVQTRVFNESQLDAFEGCDALFIRSATRVGNTAYRLAERAEAMGIRVIDDPSSILIASNKAFQVEYFGRIGVPIPRSRLIRPGNLHDVAAEIGFPCVLKSAYGCFGREVFLIHSLEELQARVIERYERDELLVLQQYVRSDFDWRIGVLNGELLFAARYNYVPGYWKSSLWQGDEQTIGHTDAVPRDQVPPLVAACALGAARATGSGLYGLDIKETDQGVFVLEINDNADLDLDCEDAAEGEVLYQRLIDALLPGVMR